MCLIYFPMYFSPMFNLFQSPGVEVAALGMDNCQAPGSRGDSRGDTWRSRSGTHDRPYHRERRVGG